MLKRAHREVDVLSRQADLQQQRLKDIRKTAKAWKLQTFGRPESLILAFTAGFALAGRSGDTESEDEQRAESSTSQGKSRALKTMEAAFLAWRLIGKPIADATGPSPTDAA